MKQTTTYGLPSRMLAGLLSLCMILTTFIGLGFFPVVHAAAGNTIPAGGKITKGGTYTVNDTYTGCIVIDTSTASNKDVTIDGTGTIIANGGSAILITGGANVTLKGSVTVTGGTGTWLTDTGLELAGRNIDDTTLTLQSNYHFRPTAGGTDDYGVLFAGTKVKYMGAIDGHWLKVYYDGKTGWINDGAFDLNNLGTKHGQTLVGGGVYVEKGTFNFTSGTITENTAHRGGGIFVNQNATLNMTGGTVSDNETIDTNASHDENHNLAGEGGGIFVYGTATISGGQIINNTCNSTTDLGGGGLYVNNNAKAVLRNAIIRNNTADGWGGGIAGCCHGAAALVATDGAAIYDNTAKGEKHTLGKHGLAIDSADRDATAEVIDHYNASYNEGIRAGSAMDIYNAGASLISNYMVGGGSEKYSGIIGGVKTTVKDEEVLEYDDALKKNVGLTAHPSKKSKEDAETTYEEQGGVLIEGNTSTVHGGGIGCNGVISFGTDESRNFEFEHLELELDANKKFNNGAPKAGKFTFGLYYDEACTQEAAIATNGADGKISFSFTEYQKISDHVNDNKITFYLKEIVPSPKDDSIFYDQSVYEIVLGIEAKSNHQDYKLDPADSSSHHIDVHVKSTTYTQNSKQVTKVKDEYGNVLNELVSSGTPSFNNTDAGQLIVRKTVTGKDADKSKKFNFTVKFTAPAGKTVDYKDTAKLAFSEGAADDHAWDGNVLTFTLKDGESVTISKLPVGTKYEVTEESYTKAGYTTSWTGDNESGTISTENKTVALTCTNNYNPGSAKFTPKVEKTLTGAEKLKDGQSLTFEFAITAAEGTPMPNNTTATVTIGNNTPSNQRVASFGDITYDKPGTYTYTITETAGDDACVDYDTSVWTLTVDVKDEGGKLVATGTYKKGETEVPDADAASFENTYETGDLKVTKTVTGSAGDTTKAFNFEVTFTAPDGRTAPEWQEVATLKFGDDSVDGHNVAWNGSKLTFTLKHDETLTVEGLPVGTKYTVTEDDYSGDGYTTTATGSSGDIKIEPQEAVVTNDKPGDGEFTPKVEKKLTGPKASTDVTFTFTLIPNDSAPMPGKGGDTVTIKGAGSGSFGNIKFTKEGKYTYTITETDDEDSTEFEYDTSKWTLTVTVKEVEGKLVATGVYTKDGLKTTGASIATFTNTRKTGDLTVSKTVTGNGGDTDKEFHFTVTLSDTTISGTFGDMTFTNGSVTFTLKNGESKTAKGLPAGVGYTVTETEANTDNYTTKYNGEVGKTNATGTITTGESTVNVENNRVVGSLKIKKSVVGGGDEAANKTYTFTVTGPNGYKNENVTVKGNGETTLDNLVPGEYTITENETDAQVNGYTLNVTYGEAADGKITVEADETASTEITVTNTYTPEPTPVTVEVSVTKVWEDTGNEDARPESVTVQLYRDGAAYDTAVTLNADNDWSHTWIGLPDGHEYTVSEPNVPAGYTSSAASVGANSWTITNTYTPEPEPETVSVSVSKVWNDTGNEDARPASVTVQLYQDGAAYDTAVTLNADNDWSHTWIGLPDGHEYTVSEPNVPAGYTSSTTSVGNRWTITNTPEPEPETVEVSVSKVWNDAGNEDARPASVTVQLYQDGAAYDTAVTLNADNEWSHTWTDLPDGHEYTVSETNVPAGYTSSAASVGNSWTITNTYTPGPEPEYGSLTISKSISGGPADIGDETFTFTVTGPDGYSRTVTITGEGSVTLDNLVPGTYTVTEADAGIAGWNWQATGTGTVVVSANAVSTASVTNTYSERTGGLSVSKTVTGSAGELEREFNFTVTLDTAISGTYGGMTFTNGVARFTLSSGESVTATGLPVGTGYTVVEAEANEDGYTTTSTGATGTIAENVTASAVFVNTNDEEYGGLTVTKTVTGTDGEPDRAFNFTVTLDDTTINGTYGGMTFTNGVASFTLSSGESVTASGLPAGTGYTVTEAEANLDGYTTTATGMTGTIAENVTSVALFTNHRDAEVYGALTIRKAVVGGGDAAANRTYTFTVTGPDGYSETVTVTGNGSATLNDLVPGEYTVTEADANIAGQSLETTGTGNVTVTANMTAEAIVTNTYTNRVGGLTVTKTVTGIGDATREFSFTVTLSDTTVNGTYGGMTFVNGIATFTLSHGESVSASGLPADIGYTVTETGANSDGYITSVVGASAGTITADAISAIEFINDMPVVEYGSLSVTKTVTGAGDTTTAFNFTVTLADTTVNGTYGDMTFVNGVAVFTLRHGETATATGLPAGTSYVVSEETEVGYTTSSTGAVGAIPANGTAAAEFVNYMPMPDEGSLTVTKIVSGNASNTADAFTFVITLADATVNGTYGDMTFANGVATVMLRHGETASASGLPAGINYTVTELEANTDNYMTYAVGDTGTIPAGGVAQSVFYNRRNVTYPDNERLGTIVTRKVVSGSEGELDREFHFTLTLTDTTVNGTYGELMFTNGVATFALRNGESVWARDLPTGIGYTVTELEANYDGYETTSVGAIGVIAEDTINEVRFVNHRGDSDEFDEWEDLFDPDIPLSDFPFDDFDDWDIPLSDIDLVSMTGDIGINTGFWMIAMTVSLTGIILTLLTESRKRRYAVAKRRHASRD